MKDSDLRDRLSDVLDYLSSNRRKVMRIAGIVLIVVIAVLLKAGSASKDRVIIDSADDDNGSVVSEAVNKEICVDISGEVINPGIYILEEGTRLYELIEKAGGLQDDADLDMINQAETVSDGQKIIIPAKTENESAGVSGDDNGNADNGLININSAPKDKLMELPGVGEAIAQRIVDDRTQNRFIRKEDIKNVSGIGDKTYEKMESLITT